MSRGICQLSFPTMGYANYVGHKYHSIFYKLCQTLFRVGVGKSPKISPRFLPAAKLKRNSEDEKGEKDFLGDQA